MKETMYCQVVKRRGGHAPHRLASYPGPLRGGERRMETLLKGPRYEADTHPTD